jgi:hypothetical protein
MIAARLDQAATDTYLRCSPVMNTLLRPLGLDALGYAPCSFDCAQSRNRASERLEMGRAAGMREAIEWLEAMLGWPAEWTALHGIAEVKTGVVKIVYDTDFSPGKLSIRYHGQAKASDAARGLSFAYREPTGPSPIRLIKMEGTAR